MTERQKLEAKALGRSFFDMCGLIFQCCCISLIDNVNLHRTDTPSLGLLSKDKPHFSWPSPNSSVVADILPILSTDEPKSNLATFTSFRTRYYNSDTGKASSEWLLQRIQNYTAELASEEQKGLISVEPFKHTWKQTSVVRLSHSICLWKAVT